MQWGKDLRRTVDFLKPRNDIRSDRIGYFGRAGVGRPRLSALAVEPRIKAAGALLGRIRECLRSDRSGNVQLRTARARPTLMLNGRYDTVYPYETSQLPFFNYLGTPARDKKMVMSNTGHILQSIRRPPHPGVVRQVSERQDGRHTGRVGRTAAERVSAISR